MPRRKSSQVPEARAAIVRSLLYLNACIWFCLGTYLMVDMFRQNNGFSAILAGSFLYVNTGAMFVSGKYIGQKKRWAYYFGLFALIANALVTRIGQFGFFDVLALIFDIIIFCGILLIDRGYLKP